jgi:hypothetical protein
MRAAVLGKLSLRDMAAVAATCREWDAWCCAQQRAVTRLVLQPGLSYAAVRGCIARCQQASVVDLSRLERGGHRLTTSSPSAVAEVREGGGGGGVRRGRFLRMAIVGGREGAIP